MRIVLIWIPVFTLMACGERGSEVRMPEDPKTSQYIGPHHTHHQKYSRYHFTTEAQWDSLNQVNDYEIPPTGTSRHPNYKVFAWHLYAKGTAYRGYDFNLMWAIAYFAYHIDPQTGSYRDIHQWKTTGLITMAQGAKCKVLLTIANFGAQDNTAFLNNTQAQAVLADSLVTLLDLRGADGINIDFEGIPGGSADKLSSFVKFISGELKAHNPNYLVTLALYAVDSHAVFDIQAIDQAVDFYTLMGYDYYGGFSDFAGPVSPLHPSDVFGQHSLSTSVEYYFGAGVAPSKLIAGLPYYGAEWQTDDMRIPSRAIKFISHHPYGSVQEVYVDSLKCAFHLDTLSSTAYAAFRDGDGTYRQVWYDDRTSLSRKYDWIRNTRLAGVGIWVPAYGQDYTELWTLLGEKFGQH